MRLFRWILYTSKLFCAFSLFFSLGGLFAQQTDSVEAFLLHKARLYENVEIRQKLEQTLLNLNFETASMPHQFYQQANGRPVTVFMYKNQNIYFIDFDNTAPGAQALLKVPRTYARGSYHFQKDMVTSRFIQLKIFFQDDADTYILLKPAGDFETRMSIYLYGERLYTDVPVPMGMSAISVCPLSKLMATTRMHIDWASILQPAAYTEWDTVQWMTEQIRPCLPAIDYVNDGAQNEAGQFVFIKDQSRQPAQEYGFNCSGFIKWLVDGLYRPLTGNCMPIVPLKQSTHYNEENRWNRQYDTRRDPYFGLDWIRNLVYCLHQVYNPFCKMQLYESDVQYAPFFSFRKNIGFPLEKIKSVLYVLAIQYPGEVFLGSVSTEFGKNPILHQHRHVTSFFPYFDENGQFRINIFDVGVEKTTTQLNKRYPKGFVYLVRVPGSRNFSLPSVTPPETQK